MVMMILPAISSGVATYEKVPFVIVGKHNTIQDRFDVEFRVKNRQLVYGDLWIYKNDRYDRNFTIFIKGFDSYECSKVSTTIYNMVAYVVMIENYIFCIGFAGRIVVE